jgi:Pyruvate/2-oxoacid:ferredoxin oxidoreductase gamma subunit
MTAGVVRIFARKGEAVVDTNIRAIEAGFKMVNGK